MSRSTNMFWPPDVRTRKRFPRNQPVVKGILWSWGDFPLKVLINWSFDVKPVTQEVDSSVTSNNKACMCINYPSSEILRLRGLSTPYVICVILIIYILILSGFLGFLGFLPHQHEPIFVHQIYRHHFHTFHTS